MSESLQQARQHAADLPCWSGPVDPQPLAGGMSNHNFLVVDNARRCVARIGGDHVVHNVMRFNEHACARAAHACGLAPAVRHAGERALVTDFVAGRTWATADAVDNLERASALIKTLHATGAQTLRGPVLCFSVFHVIRHYAKLLDDGASRLRADLPRFVQLANDLEAVAGSGRMVLCHNDLLAANFIDDGERLWLIDYEHAGLGFALFDLANFAANNALDDDAQQRLLTHYHGTTVDALLWQKFGALRVLSLLREAMWSLVSELHSRIDFDFVRYSDENLAAFETALGGWRAS